MLPRGYTYNLYSRHQLLANAVIAASRRLIAVRWRAGLMKRPRKRLRMSSLLLASINTHYNVFLSERIKLSGSPTGRMALLEGRDCQTTVFNWRGVVEKKPTPMRRRAL